MNKENIFAVTIVFALLGGCAVSNDNVLPQETQLQDRQIQTREYERLDKELTMRSVIATLQDLGFTIDQADVELGAITATRLDRYTMRMTVTVTERSPMRVAVRANARINEHSVKDAVTYQDFFVSLDKALFLTQNNVN